MGFFFPLFAPDAMLPLLFSFPFYSQHYSKGPLMVKLAVTIRNEILEEWNSGDGFCLLHRVALEALSGARKHYEKEELRRRVIFGFTN